MGRHVSDVSDLVLSSFSRFDVVPCLVLFVYFFFFLGESSLDVPGLCNKTSLLSKKKKSLVYRLIINLVTWMIYNPTVKMFSLW